MSEDIKIGQLVRSKSGRDCGHYYLVWDKSEDDRYLWLVDGRKRSLSAPKRKNAIHVQVIHKVACGMAGRKAAAGQLKDEDIRAYLLQMEVQVRE